MKRMDPENERRMRERDKNEKIFKRENQTKERKII